ASANRDMTVNLREVAGGGELRVLTSHSNAVPAIAFSPDGGMLALSGADNTVRVWEVASGRELWLSGHLGSVTAVAFSMDGRNFASGSSDTTIKLWDAR